MGLLKDQQYTDGFHVSGLKDQMDITEGQQNLQNYIDVAPDIPALQQPYKLSPVLDAPAFDQTLKLKMSGLLMRQPNTLMVNGSTDQLL